MKKQEVFLKTYKNLKNALKEYYPPENDLLATGFIVYYELLFDSTWKYMREILMELGIPKEFVNSPRTTLKEAFANNLITNEDLWIRALKIRNETVYHYDFNLATKTLDEIQEKIIPIFDRFFEKIKDMEE